jgi:quinolinate synthase
MANLSTAALARVSPLYDRVRRVIPPPEWAVFAEDVDAILALKRGRNAVARSSRPRVRVNRASPAPGRR